MFISFKKIIIIISKLKSSRKVAINWLPDLSHHRAYRSVHGGLLE
jgi:hypothetical protein